MHSILIGVLAFSLGSAGSVLAVRGFTSSENMFSACANNGGNVRVLFEGDTCKPGEIGFMFPSQGYVDAEAAARKLADAALEARLNGLGDILPAAKAYTDDAVNAEAAARQAGDAALQTNLDNETAARRQGDADTLAAANAYTDAHAGGRLSLQILSTRVSNAGPLDVGGTLTASVACTGGRTLVGGGASSSNSSVVLHQSFPASTLQWTASARAVAPLAAFGAGLTVYAICAG